MHGIDEIKCVSAMVECVAWSVWRKYTWLQAGPNLVHFDPIRLKANGGEEKSLVIVMGEAKRCGMCLASRFDGTPVILGSHLLLPVIKYLFHPSD